MSKAKQKPAIEAARKAAWEKINRRANEAIGRKQRRGAALAPELKRSDEKSTWDDYGGDADKILNHAEHFTTTKRGKLDYLKWALGRIRSSARYVLREHVDRMEKERDAKEYSRNPERFEAWNRYITVDDPCEILEAEIARIEWKGSKPTQLGRGYNWDVLEPYEAEPGKPLKCSDLRNNMKIPEQTFRGWHKLGRQAADSYRDKIAFWEKTLGYETRVLKKGNVRKNLLLRLYGENALYVLKKDLINFFKFTGYLE